MSEEMQNAMERYDRLVEDQRRLLDLYKMLGVEGSCTPFPAATGKIVELMRERDEAKAVALELYNLLCEGLRYASCANPTERRAWQAWMSNAAQATARKP